MTKVTGWDNGLCQDYDKGLGRWFANRLGARQQLRQEIVERDNLRYELKVAQEGWRCECSTDDACRFARERDALRAELAEIAADEPVMFAYEYSDGSWHDASSTEHSAGMKPLFTHPMPAQDVTLSLTDEQRTAIYESVKYEDNEGYWAVNCSDVIDATLAALSKYKGAK